MSNARNLSKFKPSSSGLVETADIADDAITNAKVADDAVNTAQIADDAVTTAKVNPAQTDITSVGTLTGLTVSGDTTISRTETNGTVRLTLSNTGANGSTEYSELKLNSTAGGTQTSVIQHRNNYGLNIGTTTDHPVYFLQNNLTAMAIDTDGNVGIGVSDPSHQLHIESSGANTYATMKLEGQNRGGQIDMFQNTLITNQILGDQSGNLYIGSSGGFGQVALDSQLQLNSYNKAFSIRQSTFLTQLADDASRTIVANGQGLIIVTSYNHGLTCIARHEYQNIVQIISANSTWSNTDTDGKFCLLSGTNDYSVTLKNRNGGARDLKAIFIGTYQ